MGSTPSSWASSSAPRLAVRSRSRRRISTPSRTNSRCFSSRILSAASRRPYTQLVTVNYPRDNGRQAYNSMTLEAKRRVGWITFDGYWTWAHNMLNYLNLENPYNTLLWNRDDVTNRHRAVVNSVFE